MNRAVLQACLPWLALLAASLAVACLLIRVNRSQVRFRGLFGLHRDEAGGVQTLSFVLTLPIFVWVMMLIVQVSQLMIATVVVHYAAFAAARSATVWIPATLASGEGANQIATFAPDPDTRDQVWPVMDPNDPSFGPSGAHITYRVTGDEAGSLRGPKYQQIRAAAVLACTPIAPSRYLGIDLPTDAGATAGILNSAYTALAPSTDPKEKIAQRLQNKLAYAMGKHWEQNGERDNTVVEVRFYHDNTTGSEPLPLLVSDDNQFGFGPFEAGWQDPITVTVTYHLALLPGPGRLLLGSTNDPQGKVYYYKVVASAVLGNEGQKPMVPYVHANY